MLRLIHLRIHGNDSDLFPIQSNFSSPEIQFKLTLTQLDINNFLMNASGQTYQISFNDESLNERK